MTNKNIHKTTIRNIKDSDINEITEIYSYFVLNGLASFEEIPPDIHEMKRRCDSILQMKRPYFVAEIDGRVVGYAYASDYRTRIAYRYTLEDSVYVHSDFGGHGVGLTLLQRVVDDCERLGYRQLIAVIGDSEHLPSIRLHEKAGFQHAGLLRSAGFKFGRWVDSILMQRSLGASDSDLPVSDPDFFCRNW